MHVCQRNKWEAKREPVDTIYGKKEPRTLASFARQEITDDLAHGEFFLDLRLYRLRRFPVGEQKPTKLRHKSFGNV